MINSESWHYVCLQGSGAALAYPELWGISEPEGLDCMRTRIMNNCSSSTPVYFMTWAYKDGMTWLEGYSDDYFDMQQKIFNETLSMADERDLMVAPVGWTWKSVISQKEDLNLFDVDNSHPSLYGSYLSACVIFCTIFQESLSENSFLAGIPEDDALFLQNAASDELMINGHLYNIVPPDTNVCDPE